MRESIQNLKDHEAFAMAMLHWLKSKGFLGSLAFGGETMLRLCHELPRYSFNMVFWFCRNVNYERFYDQLFNALSRDHDVIDAQNTYRFIMADIQRKEGRPRLKIEINKAAASPGTIEEKIAFSSYFPVQVLVKGFTLEQMLKNKVVALIARGDIRDAFDLEFLARKGIALNLAEEQKTTLITRLREFKKRDFDVKLNSSLLQPELKDYYRRQRFAYLKEKLSFEQWVMRH